MAAPEIDVVVTTDQLLGNLKEEFLGLVGNLARRNAILSAANQQLTAQLQEAENNLAALESIVGETSGTGDAPD